MNIDTEFIGIFLISMFAIFVFSLAEEDKMLITEVEVFSIDGKIISVGDKYTHTLGQVYKVICFTNIDTIRPKKYPESVVYQNVENDRIYSRPISDWFTSMTKV